MIQDEFKNSIERGLGRAVSLRKAYSQEDFAVAILHASIHNCSYDAQCECSRAEYLHEIISLSPQNDYLRKTILSELGALRGEYWDLNQMFDLAKAFSLAGDPSAKKILYAAFQSLGERRMEFVGTESLLELDGLNGLLFIAEVKGKRLVDDPEYWEDDWDIVYAKDLFPTADPEAFLKEHAQQNRLVKAYLDGVAKCLARRAENNRMVWDYEHFQQCLDSEKRVSGIWGKKLSPADRLRIAHELRQEEKTDKIAAYLAVFTSAAYPLEIDHLLQYATCQDEAVQAKATMALKFFQDNRVRELVLRNLRDNLHVWESAEALADNFREEDCALLETILSPIDDRDAFHSAALSLIHIFKKNPTPKAVGFLSEVYKNGYCSSCRGYAITSMIASHLLPDWMAEEALWDCDKDTRKDVREYLERSEK